MNRRIIISIATAVASTFAGAAFAESPLAGVETKPFVSTKSRAEVVAELQEYKRSGVNPWSMSYNPLRTFRSTTTREAVAAEYVNSRDQVAAFNGEDSGSAYLARNGGQPSPDAHIAQTASPTASE